MKILVTGASGFIGSHIVEDALERGWEVYAGIRQTSSRRYLQDPRIRVFPVDLRQPEALEGDLGRFTADEGGFDYIVHNAGVTKPRDPKEFITGNADFTRAFATAALRTQPNLKKFVFIGSIAALGPGDQVTLDAIHEDVPPQPITPYGQSKLLAEQYLNEIADLPFVTIRPAAVYGPRDEKFVLRMVRLFERGIEVQLGPADQALSFVHVHDLARVIVDACAVDYQRTAYLVSDGAAYPQRHFNQFIKDALGVKTWSLRVPTPVLTGIGYASFRVMGLFGKSVHLSHYKMREITARNWKLDISKVQRELNFTPDFDLESGLQQTVDWYKRQNGK